MGIVKVYTDYLSFLLSQTRRHLRDITGVDPWLELHSQAEIVLTHPNSWRSYQQQCIFEAAVAAGLLTDDGFSRLSFFEEGEASATFCMATQTAVASQIQVRSSHFLECMTTDECTSDRQRVHCLRCRSNDCGHISIQSAQKDCVRLFTQGAGPTIVYATRRFHDSAIV